LHNGLFPSQCDVILHDKQMHKIFNMNLFNWLPEQKMITVYIDNKDLYCNNLKLLTLALYLNNNRSFSIITLSTDMHTF